MKYEVGRRKNNSTAHVGFDSLINVQAIIANAQSRAEYKHLQSCSRNGGLVTSLAIILSLKQ